MKRNDRRRILAAVALAAALMLFLCGCSGAETAAGDFAALPSAEPQYVGAWPENDLTARIPEPQDGAVDYVRDFSDDGKYEIVWDFGSDAAFEEYIDTLHVQGYAEVAAASESASSGMLLEKDGVYLSIAYSGGTMNLLIMRETL